MKLNTKKTLKIITGSSLGVILVFAIILGIAYSNRKRTAEPTLGEQLNLTSKNLINIIDKNMENNDDKEIISFSYKDKAVLYSARSNENIFTVKLLLKDNSAVDWLKNSTIKATSYTVEYSKKHIVVEPTEEDKTNLDGYTLSNKVYFHKSSLDSPNTYISGITYKDLSSTVRNEPQLNFYSIANLDVSSTITTESENVICQSESVQYVRDFIDWIIDK